MEVGTTLFNKALQNTRDRIWGPIFLQVGVYKFIEFGDEHAAAAYIAEIDRATSEASELSWIAGNRNHLREILTSREQIRRNPDRFEFYSGQFTESGLTDWTVGGVGSQTYLVFIDMHS